MFPGVRDLVLQCVSMHWLPYDLHGLSLLDVRELRADHLCCFERYGVVLDPRKARKYLTDMFPGVDAELLRYSPSPCVQWVSI